MFAKRIVRLVGAVALAAITFVTGCVTPLGPGYRFAARQSEISGVATDPPHVHVRISDSLENAGNRNLSFLDISPPMQLPFSVTHLAIRIAGGEEQPLVAATSDSGPMARLHFDPPWAQRQAREITFEYDVPVTRNTSFAAAGTNGFYLVDPMAFPNWTPPPGVFAKGEARALGERLLVTAPADWLVLAPGGDQRKTLVGGAVRHEFRISGGDFSSYVIAGKYHELRIQTSSRPVVFWTFNPLNAAVVQATAERLANAVAADEYVFGTLPGKERIIRVIEAPSDASPSSDANGDIRASSFPGGVLLDPADVVQGSRNEHAMEMMENMLVRSWLGWRVQPRPDSRLARGAARFAELLSAEARDRGEGRQRMVTRTIAAYDGDSSSSAPQQVLRAERAFLFLVALQDIAGDEKFARAMRHIMEAMVGQEVGDEELRAALEAETRRDLAGTFRTWTGDRGLPAEFRARYAAKQ